MRKASRILLLIGAIISIVLVVTFLILGIVFAYLGSPAAVDAIREGIRNGEIVVEGSLKDIELAIQVYQSSMLTSAATFFVLFGLNIANTVLSFIARVKQTKALYILSIVFGGVSGSELSLLGGIFGLVANARGEE